MRPLVRFALLLAALAATARAAVDLVDARVYPMPWKPGSGDPAHDTPSVIFDRLAPHTQVTIFTLRGQKVWRGDADSAGLLRWAGVNEGGRMVGSGTYLAVLSGGGRKTTRRVIVIR